MQLHRPGKTAQDVADGAVAPPAETRRARDMKANLRGMDFESGQSALEPKGEPTRSGGRAGASPRSYEPQIERYRALVLNDGPPQEVQMPAKIEPREPPPGLEGVLTAEEYGELLARIEAGFRTDPLFAMFESMGFDPKTTMKSIELLRFRDRTATYNATALEMMGPKVRDTASEDLAEVESDPSKYVDVLTRARSLLHFGAAAQLMHGLAGGGVGQDDELVGAARDVVEGYTAYLVALTTSTDQDERFAFEMEVQQIGSPSLDVLEALRVLQVRDPALAAPLGAALFAAWDAARQRIIG